MWLNRQGRLFPYPGGAAVLATPNMRFSRLAGMVVIALLAASARSHSPVSDPVGSGGLTRYVRG